MSATDARYEDSSTYDHETKIDHDGNTVLSDGPVLLPVDVDDSAAEKTDDSSSLPDHDPTAVVDGEEPTDVHAEPVGGDVTDLDDDKLKDTSDETPSAAFATDSTGVTTGTTDDKFGTTDSTDLTPDGDDVVNEDVVSDDTAATVGPDTETGALKDPVPDETFAADDADTSVTPVPVAAVSETTSTPATSPTTLSAEWLELQGRFVDDPAAAVKEAGAKVEAALAELRSKIEGGSTEDLRTAFRRYRELHAGLS